MMTQEETSWRRMWNGVSATPYGGCALLGSIYFACSSLLWCLALSYAAYSPDIHVDNPWGACESFALLGIFLLPLIKLARGQSVGRSYVVFSALVVTSCFLFDWMFRITNVWGGIVEGVPHQMNITWYALRELW